MIVVASPQAIAPRNAQPRILMPHRSSPARRIRARRALTVAALTLAGVAGSASAAWAVPVPPNDDFANAAVIALNADGTGATVNADNTYANRETGEPRVRANDSGSLWYRITSPVTRPMVLETCNTADFDTLLGVYTGSAVDALTFVTENDDHDACEDNGSQVDFLAEAGVTYFVQVAGYDEEETGTFVLRTAAALAAPDVDDWFGRAVNPRVDRPTFGSAPAFPVDTTCFVDDGAGRACSLPHPLQNGAALSDGEHQFKAQASFGSLLSPVASEYFTVDTVAPTVEITAGPTDGTEVSSFPAHWNVTSNEESVGISCVIDGSPHDCSVSYIGPNEHRIELPELCAGEHTIAVAGEDEARNQGVPSAARRITAVGGPACAAPEFAEVPYSDFTYPTAAGLRAELTSAQRAGTRHTIEYGLTRAYGSRKDGRGPTIGSVASGISLDFLTPGTTYHARWIVENAAGRAVSDDFPFTTPADEGPAIPLTPLPVTGRTLTAATVSVDTPNDRETKARFEYGTSESYGSTTPTSRGNGAVAATLTDLQPRTTYHYRLVAVTDETHAVTPDLTFTTGPDPVVEGPQVQPPPSQPIAITPGTPNPRHPLTDRITADLRKALRAVKPNRKGLRKGSKLTFKLKTRTAGVTRLSGTLRRGKSKKSITVGTAKKANKKPTKKASTVVIKLPVGKKAKREARRKGKLTITLKAQFVPKGGKQAITVTRKVTVK
jgi:hypothetical protein